MLLMFFAFSLGYTLNEVIEWFQCPHDSLEPWLGVLALALAPAYMIFDITWAMARRYFK